VSLTFPKKVIRQNLFFLKKFKNLRSLLLPFHNFLDIPLLTYQFEISSDVYIDSKYEVPDQRINYKHLYETDEDGFRLTEKFANSETFVFSQFHVEKDQQVIFIKKIASSPRF
jgi:hypothetical protein